MFFSNSNIDSKEEFEKRLDAAKTLSVNDNVELIVDEYDHEAWLKEVALGYEHSPEKGARCERCFKFNLARAAKKAAELGLEGFATSLTVSPHKVSSTIFSSSDDPKFIKYDFKKKEGFKLSTKRAAELGLYRQSYCGCEFSKNGRPGTSAPTIHSTRSPNPRIALTGGIACGKSLVAKMMNEMGVKTIDADDIVHEILPDPEIRKRLAAEVFADPEKRRALEAKLHPLVREKINEFLSGVPRTSPPTISRVAIIPLLFETGWDKDYDIIIALVSDREKQIERMMTTRGYTREEAESRINAQMDVQEKAKRSTYVIYNNGSIEDLRNSVERIIKHVR